MNGVMNVPQLLFEPVIMRTASRNPWPSPSKSMPSDCIGREPPGCFALNQPKNSPLVPDEAVNANVPEALSLSLSVFAGILSAYHAGVDARQTVPPISPASLLAKWVPVLYPKSCFTVGTDFGTI